VLPGVISAILMMRWTINRWRSTLRRVVNPPEAPDDLRRRLSLGMSFIPNYDAVVSRSQSTAKHRNVGRLPSPTVVPPVSSAPQATPPPNSAYPVRVLLVPLVIQWRRRGPGWYASAGARPGRR
jgi:hypothetical protein